MAGANVIQPFAVSCNSYAWYNGGFVPPQPGLKYDFLNEGVELGQKKGMLVMGYFCIGANSKWGKKHLDASDCMRSAAAVTTVKSVLYFSDRKTLPNVFQSLG